jgi:hypothetical protein
MEVNSMTPEKFIREANYLFTPGFQNSVRHENPDVISSQKLNRKFKAFVKSQFPDCELHDFHGGYCESSGFVEKDGKFVYISISDLRYWKNWAEDVLIRTATSAKDYHGGPSHRATIKNLKADVYKLLG